jgi:hypothetical protein
MPPKTPKPSNGDLFRMLLENIIDQRHELVRLSRLIDWERFDEAFGSFYDDQKGREGLPTRLPLGGASLACRAMDGRAAPVEAYEGVIGRAGLGGMAGKSILSILLRRDLLPAQIAF